MTDQKYKLVPAQIIFDGPEDGSVTLADFPGLAPDFAKLRAERNRARDEWCAKMQAAGWLISPCTVVDDDTCYCACATGGPCEHKWDGEWWTSDDGLTTSRTCSRCGMPAVHHDLRREDF